MVEDGPMKRPAPKSRRRAGEIDGKASLVVMGCKIRSIRIKRGLSLSQVSRGTKLSMSILSQIENDKIVPKLSTLCALSEFYSVRISNLLSNYGVTGATFYKGKQRSEIINVALEPGRICLGRHIGEELITESHLITHIAKRRIVSSTYKKKIELIYVLEGNVTYEIAGKSYKMSAGDSIIYHGGQREDIYVAEIVPVRLIKITSALRESQ